VSSLMIRSGKQTGRIKSPKSIVKYALKEIVIQVFYLYKTISGGACVQLLTIVHMLPGIYDSEWMAPTTLIRVVGVSSIRLTRGPLPRPTSVGYARVISALGVPEGRWAGLEF
jgi:hypothetical protein